MTPEELARLVSRCLTSSVDRLGGDLSAVPDAVTVERPRNPQHGDYATNAAMQTGKRAGLVPRTLAVALAECLSAKSGVAGAEVAGPGFVNITLDTAAAGALASTIVAAGPNYGHTDKLAGQRVNLEFVSANPTGPVHIGGVRWAAVGDALGRVLTAAGADVTREYYFNDAGAQIDRFAASLFAAANGEPTPQDGYGGDYIDDIADRVVALDPTVLDMPRDDALTRFRDRGVQLMLAEIKQSLADFGVVFDVYFNEKQLHDGGELEQTLAALQAQGHTYERDGAMWLRTTDFGDDKDRVLRKSDGAWTYFAADCAYYRNKRGRGFDRCVYMLGADHHGYVGRLRALAASFGDDPDLTLEVLIGQMVNLLADGKPVRMSKRAGTVVLLSDLVAAIGTDAARYALARYSADSPIDLDLDLWARKTMDNPVFYVQYAHARMSSILRNADDLGIERGEFDAGLLNHPREGALLGALGEFPRVVGSAAELREPHRVARYLEDTAAVFHRFYEACQVLPKGDEGTSDLHRARLWLVLATRQVLANGLALLGVTAPDRM